MSINEDFDEDNPPDEDREQFIDLARNSDHVVGSDNEVEIDDNAALSIGSAGVWVAALVFVDKDDVPDSLSTKIWNDEEE
jgi:hypothetical protein